MVFWEQWPTPVVDCFIGDFFSTNLSLYSLMMSLIVGMFLTIKESFSNGFETLPPVDVFKVQGSILREARRISVVFKNMVIQIKLLRRRTLVGRVYSCLFWGDSILSGKWVYQYFDWFG